MLKALLHSIPSPSLTFKSVAYHTMSVVSGIAFCFTFAASHKVDLYAIWDAMGKVYADTLSLVALVLPLAGLFGAGWRTWKMKQVPRDTPIAPQGFVITPAPGYKEGPDGFPVRDK